MTSHIGAGKIELTPDGYFTAATINNNQDCPIYRMPGSFFAIRAERGESRDYLPYRISGHKNG
jgi:hypothetical protein